MEILNYYPQEITLTANIFIVALLILLNHGFVEFGLRIGLHRIRKPSGGWVRPAKKPSGGKVRRVEAFGSEPIGPGSVETEGSVGREAFRWNGSRGPRLRAVGSAGRNADRWNGPRAAKPSGETVRRGRDLRVTLSNEPGRAETDRSTGSSCFRAAGSMGWGSSGRRINGRNA